MGWHGEHIRIVADGGPAHPDHAERVRLCATGPLDESRGEGYHRGTTREKMRAPASKAQHIKQSTRQKAAFRSIDDFRGRFGSAGDAVVRFEW
eukprot:356361-Pyramimonas_sp.AAC.1